MARKPLQLRWIGLRHNRSTAPIGFTIAHYLTSFGVFLYRYTTGRDPLSILFSFYSRLAELVLSDPLIFIIVLTASIWPFLYYRLLVAPPGVIPPGTLSDETLWAAYRAEQDLEVCFTCQIRRPLRAKHCATMDQCVARFDHYCHWIGQDVGLLVRFSFF